MTKISCVVGVKDGKAECVLLTEDSQLAKDKYLALREANGGGYDELQWYRKPAPSSRSSFSGSSAAPVKKTRSK
jgi:hypothetical protein